MGLAGRPILPADKSIAHRVALLAALAEGESEIVGFSNAADPQSTLACLRQLGVSIEERDGSLFIGGVGREGFSPPAGALDCGNSGTTMRLLAGILAGQAFDSELIGDQSLSGRPMERVADPLRQMGARITLRDGHAPIAITGSPLHGITYALPVASAQVKTAILLAGLIASGETTVAEPVASRDHTERMLGLTALQIGSEKRLMVNREHHIPSGLWVVPRDFSAATFFLVAAAIVSPAVLELRGVGLNPSRSAALDVLRAMGADISVRNHRERQREPIADLWIENKGGRLNGVTISGDIVPNLIDEIPALAVAAACADGPTVISGAAELRVKESDRIAATAAFLRAMGAAVDERPDGMVIEGGASLRGALVDSRGDHRIAMAAAVAGLAASGDTTIEGADCVAVSFPDFWTELAGVSGQG